MVQLILIRHAKSSWADASQTDHARPLNGRGRRDAPRIGAWLAAQAPRPDVALCSDAARTRETYDLIAPHWAAVELRHERGLYLAEPEAMMALLAAQTAPVVALIGHSPGIAELAHMLVETPPENPRFEDYPTAATTWMELPAWAEIAPGAGRLRGFITPHSLG